MKIEFSPDERKVLLTRFGLPAKATDADIAAAWECDVRSHLLAQLDDAAPPTSRSAPVASQPTKPTKPWGTDEFSTQNNYSDSAGG